MFRHLWIHQLRRWLSIASPRRAEPVTSRKPTCRPTFRPCLEQLEDRLTPSANTVNVNSTADSTNFNSATVTIAQVTAAASVSLLDAINAANNDANANPGDTTTINLASKAMYNLTAVDNYWYGPNGLPAISSNITIQGNGATIERDTIPADNTPNFRLIYVSGGFDGLAAGDLTLENLTLTGGLALGGSSGAGGGGPGGSGGAGGAGLGAGGAVFNQGTLDLNAVTLTGNTAQGGSSGVSGIDGDGGGGIGADAASFQVTGAPGLNGGGFGWTAPPKGSAGGAGGAIGGINNSLSPGGGGGFGAGDPGGNGTIIDGGAGGGQGALGGAGGGFFGGPGGDGGGGGQPDTQAFRSGAPGGAFGAGGEGFAGGGGGGGVGGGGGGVNIGIGFGGGGGGGFGGGGGGGEGLGGDGGFGGGGGAGGGITFGSGGFGAGSSGNSGGGGGAGMGGAVFNMFGTTTATNCTLTGNTAQGGAGAPAPVGSGLVGGGNGSGFGGAIFNLDGQLNLTFATIADNTVAAGSGGLAGSGSAGGGAVYNLAYGNSILNGLAQSATATITDSILSNSTGGVDLVNNVVNGANTNTATVTLAGPNLVMLSSGTIGGATPLTADPQLEGLANNGGPTQTMALTPPGPGVPGSPAIGVGTPVAGVTTDQRGDLRPATPSLGAYEANSGTVAVATSTTVTLTPTQLAYSSGTQTVKATAAVTDANGNAVTAGSVTFTLTDLSGNSVPGAQVVSTGAFAASVTLPGDATMGSYFIKGVYHDPAGGFIDSHKSTTFTIFHDVTQTTISKVTISSANSLEDDEIVTVNVGSNVDAGTVNVSVSVSTPLGIFKIDGGAVAVDKSGQATVRVTVPNFALSVNQTITASYQGTANFTNSSETVTALWSAGASLRATPTSIDFTGPNTETVHYLSLVQGPHGGESRVDDSIGYVKGVISQMTVDGVAVVFTTNTTTDSVTATTLQNPLGLTVKDHINKAGLINRVRVLTPSGGYAHGVVKYNKAGVIESITFS